MAEDFKTTGITTEVVLHPFVNIDGALVEAVRQAIEQRFHVRAIKGETRDLPESFYSPQRRQGRSTALLNELACNSSNETMRLGIANVDFFVPELSFVFGEASQERRVAVVSIARLDPQFYGDVANSEKLFRRASTEAIHELGHVFGLGHCERADCVMYFSNTLAQTDRKGSEFCKLCAERIMLHSGDVR